MTSVHRVDKHMFMLINLSLTSGTYSFLGSFIYKWGTCLTCKQYYHSFVQSISNQHGYQHHPPIIDFTTATLKMPVVRFPTLAEPVSLGALQLNTRVIMASLTRNRSIRKLSCSILMLPCAKARHLISHNGSQRGQRKVLCSARWAWSLRPYPLWRYTHCPSRYRMGECSWYLGWGARKRLEKSHRRRTRQGRVDCCSAMAYWTCLSSRHDWTKEEWRPSVGTKWCGCKRWEGAYSPAQRTMKINYFTSSAHFLASRDTFPIPPLSLTQHTSSTSTLKLQRWPSSLDSMASNFIPLMAIWLNSSCRMLAIQGQINGAVAWRTGSDLVWKLPKD